ncbi:MAG: hypothetical protein VB125_03580 [Burkholderia sp.]
MQQRPFLVAGSGARQLLRRNSRLIELGAQCKLRVIMARSLHP